MGNYNPNRPYILGEEFVPIRDVNLVLSPLTDTVEYGQSFTIASNTQLSQARFYVNSIPSNLPSRSNIVASIYPAGTEATSGPVRSVLIPVDAVTVSGGTVASGSPPNGATALLDPTSGYYYFLNPASATSSIWINFNTTPYSPILSGKRILGVNVIAAAAVDSSWVGDLPLIQITNALTANSSTTLSGFYTTVGTDAFNSPLNRFRLGETAPFNATTLTSNELLPWTYADIDKFDSSAGSPIYLHFHVGSNFGSSGTGGFFIWYAALEVVYCDENRTFLGTASVNVGPAPNWGANVIRMRTWQGKSQNGTITPGEYVATLSSLDRGDFIFGQIDAGLGLNATRELTAITTHRAVQTDVPYPPETSLEREFAAVNTRVIPQISLHTSGGTAFTETQVYGRVGAAWVYSSSFSPTQVLNDAGISSGLYPWVRFYARRFGDTSYPLTITGEAGLAASTASITAEEFDELDEIVDGWKEVNLRFTVPATMGGVTPSWTWSSSSTAAASRWEVLLAAAPALSGLPGNLFGQATNQLGSGTYQPSSGTTANVTWTPWGIDNIYVNSDTADSAADAVVIFAQDTPTVTGFSVDVATQAVTGIGQDCGLDPCGIPTGINYVEVSWNNPAVGYNKVLDTYTATSATWPALDTGQSWSLSAIGTATFSQAGGRGLITHASTATGTALVDVGSAQQDVRFIWSASPSPSGSGGWSMETNVFARYTDANNYIRLRAQTGVGRDRALGISVFLNSAGSLTDLFTVAPQISIPYDYTHDYGMRLRVNDTLVQAKVWDATDGEEPEDWLIVGNQGLVVTGNNAGLRTATASLLSTTIFSFDNFEAQAGAGVTQFGFWELQRSDEVTDWQTIMAATDPFLTSFNDYEARASLPSSYRMRIVDVQGFYGAWSTTLQETVTSPGVTGSCLDNAHILIFTSNESQDGAYNLAYSSTWDGKVTENFTFPEADQVTYQPLYLRDFVTAFHGTERAGVKFSRDILVQAGAISPETLEDFTDLRDMAWADLPYVCVRDEDGNRWYANVVVPSGQVQLNRTLYMSSVTITEVTDTPSQVNP